MRRRRRLARRAADATWQPGGHPPATSGAGGRAQAPRQVSATYRACVIEASRLSIKLHVHVHCTKVDHTCALVFTVMLEQSIGYVSFSLTIILVVIK